MQRPNDSYSIKLELSTGTGYVIAAHGEKAATCSGYNVDEFIDTSYFRHWSGAVRIIGAVHNCYLIKQIYEKKARYGDCILQVCSPFLCPSFSRSDRTAIVKRSHDWHMSILYEAREVCENRTSTSGGWHIVDNDDYLVYKMIDHIIRTGKIDNQAIEMCSDLRIFKILSFIPHLNKRSVTAVISSVIDPRWYISPSSVDDDPFDNLLSHLGFDKDKNQITQKDEKIREIVRSCWKTADAPSNDNISFIWRTWLRYSNEESDIMASKKFLEFLYRNWLDIVSFPENKTGGEHLFCPDHFFESKSDMELYRNYMQKVAQNAC